MGHFRVRPSSSPRLFVRMTRMQTWPSAPCVVETHRTRPVGRPYGAKRNQSGTLAYALFALLLLMLPFVLTFHALLELPRLAERRRTLAAER